MRTGRSVAMLATVSCITVLFDGQILRCAMSYLGRASFTEYEYRGGFRLDFKRTSNPAFNHYRGSICHPYRMHSSVQDVPRESERRDVLSPEELAKEIKWANAVYHHFQEQDHAFKAVLLRAENDRINHMYCTPAQDCHNADGVDRLESKLNKDNRTQWEGY
ncbi:hypothetical protein CALCODRAFT_76640 [Calocera cornea HHB12733]|uniref:Uncharacterized protein n=1 Tax=Calocera cornea HHB12733 TaxID=1353952 RepID=A0A165DI06_9BASI|nr:hypothetical protein CALCODRAFT_76640 [Calocera cornea HHB12733]